MENAFDSAVLDALSRCRHGGVLLAAVSGGADSTAMLLSASRAQERLGFSLHCLHVNHGIRSEAECDADAAAVRDLCVSLDVPCRVARIERGAIHARAASGGIGIEAAAREARHAAWAEEARRVGASRVLVAHTADDLLETALIRFIRGAGPAGLAAMAEERGLVFRPILSRTRGDVLEYLQREGLSFQTDSTNADSAYFRNRVRLRLVPLLDRDFPHWRGAVSALAQTQAEAAAFISGETSFRVRWEAEAEGRLTTDEASFFAQPDIVRQEAVYVAVDRLLAAKQGGAGPAGFADIPRRKRMEPRRAALRRFTSGVSAAIDLGAFRVSRLRGRVVLEETRSAEGEGSFVVVATAPGAYSVGPFVVRTAEAQTERDGFYSKLPMILRPVSVDDRIQIGARLVPVARKAIANGAQAGAVYVAEDPLGIAAAVFSGREGEAKLLVRDRLIGSAGYADSVFFSILLQRGYYA